MKNIINKVILNDDSLIDFVLKSTIDCFDSDKLDTLFSNEKRTIKYLRKKECVYLFDKTEKKLIIFYSVINSYYQNMTINEILYYYKKDFENNLKLYADEILTIDLIQQENKCTNEDIKTIMKKFKDNSSMIETMKKIMEEYCYNKVLFNNTILTYNYILCLNDFGYNNQNFDLNYFINRNNLAIEYTSVLKKDFLIKVKALYELSKTNKFNLENKYEFNDCDNFFWSTKYGFVISNQNLTHYFNFKNESNFEIFFFENDLDYDDDAAEELDLESGLILEILKIEENIENNKPNFSEKERFEKLVVSIIDDEVHYINFDEISYLNQYSLIFTCISLENNNELTIIYPVDINSYEYQMKFFCNRYRKTEFEFLIQSVFTLGGGFDYHEEKGIFHDSMVTYEEDILNLKPTLLEETGKIDSIDYFYLKEFSYLNEDWKNALKKLNIVLKRDKPNCTVFSEKTLEDTYEKIFKVLDKL